MKLSRINAKRYPFCVFFSVDNNTKLTICSKYVSTASYKKFAIYALFMGKIKNGNLAGVKNLTNSTPARVPIEIAKNIWLTKNEIKSLKILTKHC